MTLGLVKGTATEAWRSSFLGVAIMAAASLLWSLTSVLVVMSTAGLHASAVNAVIILCVIVVPGSVLVGGALGYWIFSARPSPIGTATIAVLAAVTLTALFLFLVNKWSSPSSNWAGATFGGTLLGLTAAPFWFVGALVLYDRVEKRLLYHTDRAEQRTGLFSALVGFFLNPSAVPARLPHPLIWASYLLVADLFLSLLVGFFVAVPLRKYFGATFVGQRSPRWTLILLLAAIEEFTFRLPLRYTASNLTISAFLFTFLAARTLLFGSGISGSATFARASLWSAVWAAALASIMLVLLRNERVKHIIDMIWRRRFRAVLYFSCIAFGLMHVYNFTSITTANLFVAPLLVLPQIISGFIFAFARMRLGMIWCIALHTAHNVLFFLVSPVRPRW